MTAMSAIALAICWTYAGPGWAQPPALVSTPTAADVEALPSSRAILASLAALTKPGFDEPSLRGLANLKPDATFMFGGLPVAVSKSSDVTKPWVALGPQGSGAVVLVKLPALAAGVAAAHVDQEATYALVLVRGTRISVRALYSQMPSEGALSRRMLAAMAQVDQPIMTFDPTFQPGQGTSPDRYVLK